MLRSLVNDLQQFTIAATDGEIGRVDHFLFDDREWVVRYLVVDTGKWLPGRRVIISPRAIVSVQMDTHTVGLNLTRQTIHDSPPVDASKPVSRQQEEVFHRYYGYPNYWGYIGGPGNWAAWAHPPGAMLPPVHEENAAGPDEPSGDGHLRSTREVAGYHLQATDGEIGNIKDFVADEKGWAIRYLVVGTGNWLAGRNVLIPRDWAQRVDWAASKVHVDVRREAVRSSPEYDPSQVLNREHEERLYQHYGRQGYWTEQTNG